MENEEKTIDKPITEKLKEETEKFIECLLEEGLNSSNVELLGDVVDIHKDLANEEYWKNKEEVMNMRYNTYGRDSYRDGNYGRNTYGECYSGSYGKRRRDSRGRYMESGRGQRYRGHDSLEEMSEHYGNYSEGRERYGAKEDTLVSLEYMLESMVDFVEMLHEDASSQEEVNLIKKYTKKISEM